MKKLITYKFIPNIQIDTLAIKEFQGIEYYLVPVVALQEQVVNQKLALEEEFGLFIDSWNGIPLPIGHPKNAVGEYISAKDPELMNSSAGYFFDAQAIDKKLKGNMWIKKEFLDNPDDDIAVAIKKQIQDQTLEVSTGYFSMLEETSGEFNGVQYTHIQRNMVPDHLALLPNDIGACSNVDGCGVRVNENNNEGEQMSFMQRMRGLVTNKEVLLPSANFTSNKDEMSFAKIESKLYEAIGLKENIQKYDFWLAEVYDSFVIYERDNKYWKVSYVVDNNKEISLADDQVEVEKHISYEPVTNQQTQIGDESMKEKVDLLINCARTKFTEADREWLMAQKEDVIDKLGVNEQEQGTDPVTTQANNPQSADPEVVEEQTEKPKTQVNEGFRFESKEDFLQAVGEVVINTTKKLKDNDEKSKLITLISTNEKNNFAKETLELMDLKVLQSIAKDLNVQNDFFGASGGPVGDFNVQRNEDDMPPAPPQIVGNGQAKPEPKELTQ
jgi:hypothetical protein